MASGSPPPAPLEPLNQFHKFPELPLEVRQMIWRYSFPGTRFVQLFPPCGDICPVVPRICNKKRWWGRREWRPRPTSNGASDYEERIGPETLRICKESPEETLRHYIPLFNCQPKAATVYFHPRQDILTLNRTTHQALVYDLPTFTPELKEQLNLIERLCFHWYDWLHPEDISDDALWVELKGVRELILQDNASRSDENDRVRFIQERLECCRFRLSEHQDKHGNTLQRINYITALDSIMHK